MSEKEKKQEVKLLNIEDGVWLNNLVLLPTPSLCFIVLFYHV